VDGQNKKIEIGAQKETDGSEKVAEGNWDSLDTSPTPTSGPAAGNVRYDELQKNARELETLSPQRRALVIRYFRIMRSSAQSQPATEENKN
jgi:hypothetical protein